MKVWKAFVERPRALELKLKERMLIKRRAEPGWAKADDKNISHVSHSAADMLQERYVLGSGLFWVPVLSFRASFLFA